MTSGNRLQGEKAAYTSSQITHRRHPFVEKMPSPVPFFLTLLFGLFITAGLANAVFNKQPSAHESAKSDIDHIVHRDDSTFSRLLSSASPQALHSFLHTYFPTTYKHGIYDSDHAAMEAVHETDPELATSIVQMAKRQQSSNETTTSTTTSFATDSNAATTTSEISTTLGSSTSDTTTTTVGVTPTVSSTSTSTQSSDSQTTSLASESTGGPSSSSSTLATTTSSAITTRPPRTSTFTSTLPGGAKVC
ncbi:hypothetical protein GGR54DRAFT_51428 [Hypoxylon sp. NC1633]|nr:hypothetical protein GGR54DRAFT_51428 [Hypoxylon sp. NC1633]